MPTSASFTASNAGNTLSPNKLIPHLLRAITTLSALAATFLLCYIIRSDDAKILFLQLFNANAEEGDAAVEQSAGARSILVAMYSCLVTACASNYFLWQEKKRTIRSSLWEQWCLSDEGLVLASLSSASHEFISFLLFGTFRINLYNGIRPGELAAFFFGLISLGQSLLFLVLTVLLMKREKEASKGNGDSTNESGTFTEFVQMPDEADEADEAKGSVEVSEVVLV
jgi:hypothetical protein